MAYDNKTMRYEDDRRADVVEFLEAIVEIEKKYSLYLAHEDENGSFLVRRARTTKSRISLMNWLMGAAEDTSEEEWERDA